MRIAVNYFGKITIDGTAYTSNVTIYLVRVGPVVAGGDRLAVEDLGRIRWTSERW